MMDRDKKAVEIEAKLRQIKTMADGTFNITLNLPEYCITQAQKLLEWVGHEITVVIEITR